MKGKIENMNLKYFVENPSGQQMDIDFINTYEPEYYLQECDKKGVLSYMGLSRTCSWIEKDMEDLLEKSEWTSSDVVHILAWKMGCINHKMSKGNEDKKEYVFTGDDAWSDKADNLKASGRKGIIENITDFVNNVLDFKKGFDEMKGDERRMLEALSNTAVEGIGSVYLITILYFVSGGEYPIYDQFAMKALKAIEEGIKPFETIKVKDLPDKKSQGFFSLLTDKNSMYMEYIERIKRVSCAIYGEDGCSKYKGKEGRKLDRALWVYGHFYA